MSSSGLIQWATASKTSTPPDWFRRPALPWLGHRAYQRCKRVLDLSLALFVLPVVLPVILVCAALVRMDSPGNPFFGQERTGRGGRRFRMWKLRTMHTDAEARKAELLALNQLSYPDFKLSRDPRVTRIGTILRRTSLDELPQIFNVVSGTMSFVGPRPTSFPESTYRAWHTARLEVTPGITGLWQLAGRGELDFDDRVRLDIAYLRHRSLWLDVRILARTVPHVLVGRGTH